MNQKFKYHYFVKNLIRPGDVILDIGANVGYYSRLFSVWTGYTGSVYAIEPIQLFCQNIARIRTKYNNIFLMPFALGNEQKNVNMGVPGNYGWLPAGYVRVVDFDNSQDKLRYKFTAQMEKGSELFSSFLRIDYVKIDVEGFEMIILQDMTDIINKYKPILQLEIWNFEEFFSFLQQIPDYIPYQLSASDFLSVISLNNFNPKEDVICIFRN